MAGRDTLGRFGSVLREAVAYPGPSMLEFLMQHPALLREALDGDGDEEERARQALARVLSSAGLGLEDLRQLLDSAPADSEGEPGPAAQPETPPQSTRDQTLLPQHAAMLRDCGISAAVVVARGYRTATTKAEIRRLGFATSQCLAPALVVPIWNVTGEIAMYQIRPDRPRIVNGKPLKYETPKGARMVLDVPAASRGRIGDPLVPLFITEGSKKVDAAVSQGICCIGVLGVWNWRGSNEKAGVAALPDWESVALKGSDGAGREVYLAFDSDVMTKPQVHAALGRLAAFLGHRGARVRSVMLPPGADASKTGLDDFLASGKGVADLVALSMDKPDPLPRDPPAEALAEAGGYRETESGIYSVREPRNEGESESLQCLSNFRARILAEVVRDDGAEEHMWFEIEGIVEGRPCRFRLPASRFNAMHWPLEQMGSGAIIMPGQAVRDHLRAAIQMLSHAKAPVPRRRVYLHLGWAKVQGGWIYLHAGGAIGTVGTVGTVPYGGVELPEELSRHVLETPVDPDETRSCVNASLSVIDVAPARIAVPAVGCALRALFGAADLSVHLHGPTGKGKSEIAALAQQHYGRANVREKLLQWGSTANALEGLLFYAKDALLVIDDFAPDGAPTEVARQHRDAGRVVRSQGNLSGRARMNADCTLRPGRPPRGVLLSTGEDTFRQQSVRARTLSIAVGEGDVDWQLLTACQAAAADGRMAKALGAFTSSLAGDLDSAKARFVANRTALRKRASGGGGHRRTPGIVADLGAAWFAYLDFALEVGAIDAARHAKLRERVLGALEEAADLQGRQMAECEPAVRFVDLLRSALASGAAYISSMHGGPPLQAEIWGWRTDPRNPAILVPQGERAGWTDGNSLYLDTNTALRITSAASGGSGDSLSISARTLGTHLKEHGLLASTDSKRGRIPVRKMIGGVRREVIHLPSAALYPVQETAQPSQSPGNRPAGPDPAGTVGGPEERSGPSHCSGGTGDRPGGAPAELPAGHTPRPYWEDF